MRIFVLVSIGALFVGCSGQSTEVTNQSTGVSSPSADGASRSTATQFDSMSAFAAPAESGQPANGSTAAPAENPNPATAAGEAGNSQAGNSQAGSPEDGSSQAGGSAAGAGAAPVAIVSGVAALSPENTRIQFVGTHAGPKPDPRTGVFTKFTGKAEVDPEKNALKSVSVEINTESLETPIPKLTNHLRSPDFFDTREFPTAKFQSSSITQAQVDGNYLITGNLTLLKGTKELKIPAKVTVSDKGLTLTAEFTIDRTDFGMSGLQDKVNKEVPMTVSIGQPTAAK